MFQHFGQGFGGAPIGTTLVVAKSLTIAPS